MVRQRARTGTANGKAATSTRRGDTLVSPPTGESRLHSTPPAGDQPGMPATSVREHDLRPLQDEAVDDRCLAALAREESASGVQEAQRHDHEVADNSGRTAAAPAVGEEVTAADVSPDRTGEVAEIAVGADAIRVSGMLLSRLNSGVSEPWEGLNGIYLHSRAVENSRPVYKKLGGAAALWWANVAGTLSWVVGPTDCVGGPSIWAFVPSQLTQMHPGDGSGTWHIFSYATENYEQQEQVGVEVVPYALAQIDCAVRLQCASRSKQAREKMRTARTVAASVSVLTGMIRASLARKELRAARAQRKRDIDAAYRTAAPLFLPPRSANCAVTCIFPRA